MKRKAFLKQILVLPLIAHMMKAKALNQLLQNFNPTAPMPVLFLGHGSPMNAIEENIFVSNFKKIGKSIPKPNAILCISAHWETKGTFVTAMKQPRTIHDFGGFPQALFDVQYPAPGSPDLAKETQALIEKSRVELDHSWGLDHGAWSVIKHLYPDANIPVVQLSLDYRQSPQYHYDLAKELSALRRKGVLIVGSGNMVHNLGKVDWRNLNKVNYGFDWALEANEKMMEFIQDDNHRALIDFRKQGKAFDLAIPTTEHYLPLLYSLALKESKDKTSIFNEQAVGGALSMTSVLIA